MPNVFDVEVIEHMEDLIKKSQEPKIFEIKGRTYTDRGVHQVIEPEAHELDINSLTGLVDYITVNVDRLEYSKLLVHVASPTEVFVLSALFGEFRQRERLLAAHVATPEHWFNMWCGSESFIIWLQSAFAEDGLPFDKAMLKEDAVTPDGGYGIKALLGLTSSMKTDQGVTADDDGITQNVTMRSGVTLVDNAKVPNPVTLRPYRTFTEIDQPESKFVFRVNANMECKLVPADGGKWRGVAMASIKEYLLKELPEDVQVIA